MGLFRRRAVSPLDAITEFWTWWAAEGASASTAAITEQRPDRMVDALSARIGAIHPELAWEFAAGQLSAHRLVATAEGNPDLRPIARRWLLAAPPADATWSYDDHRGPVDDPSGVVLRFPGAPEIGFSGVSIAARRSGARFDVTVHHPAFADLPDNARTQVAFLALDAALGENDTELWIGEIDTAAARPLDGFDLTALRSLVADVRRESVDEDGRPRWALLGGQGPRGPVAAMARSPLHPLFGPMFTRHAAAHVPYGGQTDDGFPAPASLDALRSLEDRLETAVGADGLLVAHESSAGIRTFHYYLDPEAGVVDRLVALLDDWPDGDVRIQVTDGDAGWEGVRHLRG